MHIHTRTVHDDDKDRRTRQHDIRYEQERKEGVQRETKGLNDCFLLFFSTTSSSAYPRSSCERCIFPMSFINMMYM